MMRRNCLYRWRLAYRAIRVIPAMRAHPLTNARIDPYRITHHTRSEY